MIVDLNLGTVDVDPLTCMIGADECGLGPWAGPAVACAILVPQAFVMEGLKDSKKLSKKKRERFAEELRAYPHAIAVASSEAIDQDGFHNVHMQILEGAVRALLDFPGFAGVTRIVIDGGQLPKGLRGIAEAIPEADGMVPAVMAAANIGKVHRDALMAGFALEWPEYGFEKHAGYGVPQHRKAIEEHGLCPIHRRSFSPIRAFLRQESVDD